MKKKKKKKKKKGKGREREREIQKGDFPRFQLKTTYVVKSARQLQRKKSTSTPKPLTTRLLVN